MNEPFPDVQPKSISKVVRSQNGANVCLEAALFAWVCDQANHRRMINGPLVTKKERGLQELCNEKLPPEAHFNLSFSGSWLAKLKRCWSLKLLTYLRESGDAHTNAAKSTMPYLRERTKAYAWKDDYSADKCGLFYNPVRDRRIAVQRPNDRKKAKDRVTILVCYNSDGTDEHQLFFIKTAQKPLALRKKPAGEYELAYMSNKCVPMTAEIFLNGLDNSTNA